MSNYPAFVMPASSRTLALLPCWEGEGWKKRQIAVMSSVATPRFFRFHASTAHSTSLLADLFRSGAEETISTASWLEMTSHT